MTITLKPIDQQVIVVFGASRGIGRTTALMAARRGARVVAAARNREALDSLVEEAAPGEVVTAVADEKVAEAIMRSAQRPKRDIIVGGAAKAQLLAQRVSPRLLDAFASVAGVLLQKSKQPKQPWDGDALFEPPAGDDRERGEVSTGEPRGRT